MWLIELSEVTILAIFLSGRDQPWLLFTYVNRYLDSQQQQQKETATDVISEQELKVITE